VFSKRGAAVKSLSLAFALSVALASSSVLAFAAEFLLASTADLENPHDVKLSPDGRWLFVSDVGNDRMVVLDADSLAMIGHFGADHQDGTHDVDFDEDGRLLVADTHNHRIAIYRLDGAAGTLVGELSEGIRKPEGVLAGPGGRVFATGAGSDNVVLYVNGEAVAEAGGLSAPHDVEFAPNGDLWIADAANDRLVRMTPELEIGTILEGAPYHFDGPRYLDIAPDGTVVVADKYTHSIKIIAEDGALLGVIGDGPGGEGRGAFRTPEGVELGDGILWIADSGNDRVVKYRLSWK
jgi:DNA-binding beta-propeller fold protein YncE